MTKRDLLVVLKKFTEEATKDLIMPVRMQKEDKEEPEPRAANVYMMRLKKSTDAEKTAPHIIHSIVTGHDSQPAGDRAQASTLIRTVFSVYHEDEQEGSLLLLTLMERYRIALLKKVVLDDRYALDTEDGVDSVVYTDNIRPYYAGEMITSWKIPAIYREVDIDGN
jgi:hypothetical protein